MVLREMLWIVGIGLAAGIAIALSVTRFAESQLYGVKPRDTVVVAAASLALALTAFAAGYLPARRAARVNPSTPCITNRPQTSDPSSANCPKGHYCSSEWRQRIGAFHVYYPPSSRRGAANR